jgi:PAS domain-containing protein
MVVDLGGAPWLSILCIATGIAPFLLIAALARHRGKPGVNWFIVSLFFYGVWCLTYGISLFVADLGLRLALETVSWIGFVWIGYPFLGFALDYTGRSGFRKSWLFVALAAGPALGTGLIVTNTWHGLVWQDVTVVRAYEAVLLEYTIQPMGFLAASAGLLYSSIAVLLLLETILNYGPLYRKEAIAVALSPLPPSVGLVVWWFGFGPVDAVNWGVVASLPHAALDGYAFVGKNMFETSPATRRVADETAIDTLPDPVVVLDESDRLVDFNDAAARVFELSIGEVGAPASSVVPVDALDGDYVSVSTDARHYEFAVSATPLSDPRGAVVGSTVLFRDITDEREREQRLSVLNRVLRHNLRNKLTAIGGYAAHIEETADDPELRRLARQIGDSGDELVTIGEKARTFDRLRQTDVRFEPRDVRALVADVVDGLTEEYPSATVRTEIRI